MNFDALKSHGRADQESRTAGGSVSPEAQDISDSKAVADNDGLLRRLELALKKDTDALDTVVGAEISAALEGAQDQEWAEMIKDFGGQSTNEFVMDIKGPKQSSF